METRLAEYAGFCFGVRRAVDTVYEQVKTGKTIYTYGPIVHNEEVVKELADQGVRVLETKEELETLSEGTVVIRAHGVPKEICRIAAEGGMECIDATCPFVKRIHRIVEEESLRGSHILVAGNPGHPEVEGIVGWCKGPVTVLETPGDAEKFVPSEDRKLCLVAQTTFNYNKFHSIVEIFEKKGYNVYVVNTICSATEERQRSARALAAEADVMIVIGGKHSSNTKKLYEICREECAESYFIQTLDDLHLDLPKAVRLVGITAGASTPNKLIEEVQNYVRINF
ncbi:MAG: 4-hydroxy-3-methylbut-2-enyl diphosphate reductase [Acetatifactor sp.]|nr:4-hydroxy-3-methylbut-2-enyl diphosphate reductase [Acetatifactor sp.]